MFVLCICSISTSSCFFLLAFPLGGGKERVDDDVRDGLGLGAHPAQVLLARREGVARLVRAGRHGQQLRRPGAVVLFIAHGAGQRGGNQRQPKEEGKKKKRRRENAKEERTKTKIMKRKEKKERTKRQKDPVAVGGPQIYERRQWSRFYASGFAAKLKLFPRGSCARTGSGARVRAPAATMAARRSSTSRPRVAARLAVSSNGRPLKDVRAANLQQ